MPYQELIQPINNFLLCPTPEGWLDKALDNIDLLLVDHANCEKKAASFAVKLINRYLDYPELMHKMSRLAREELRHFEQVLAIMNKRGIQYTYITAADYAPELNKLINKNEPYKLLDSLIVGAIIEARSCERFYSIAPVLDDELQKFYFSLLKSESRHYQDYLKLADDIATQLKLDNYLDDNLNKFLNKEQQLINQPSTKFRFHSGI
jgi:tRNA 2-(methylsulfanyl)-N6-isopentenyladenosine37 hydroxylase